VFVAQTRNLFMFSHFLVFYLFLSHLVATYACSFLMSLVVEAPFLALESAVRRFFGVGRGPGGNQDDRGGRKSKYYYTVNPISTLGEITKQSTFVVDSNQPRFVPPPLSRTISTSDHDGHSSLRSINTRMIQLPLTEKFSNNSVDSRSVLMKRDVLNHYKTSSSTNDPPTSQSSPSQSTTAPSTSSSVANHDDNRNNNNSRTLNPNCRL